MVCANRYVNNIFLFDIIFNFATGMMIPNYFIDISKYIKKKLKLFVFIILSLINIREKNGQIQSLV